METGLTNYTAVRGRDEEDLKLLELLRKKERAPPNPTPPNGLRKESSPDSALFQPGVPSTFEPQRGGFQDHESPTDILRPSEDARPHLIYSRRLPSTRGLPLSTERHSRLYAHPSPGIASSH